MKTDERVLRIHLTLLCFGGGGNQKQPIHSPEQPLEASGTTEQRLSVSRNRAEGYEEQSGPSPGSPLPPPQPTWRSDAEARVGHQTTWGLSQVFITKSKTSGSQDVRSCHQVQRNYVPRGKSYR